MKHAIFDYEIHEILCEDDFIGIYRATKPPLRTPLIIKVLALASAPLESVRRLRREFALLIQFNHPGIIKALALAEHKDFLVMELEDIGGKSLEPHLDLKGQPLGKRLSMAIALAQALTQMHQQRIIHLGVSPANIWYSPKSNRAQFFSLDSAMERAASNSVWPQAPGKYSLPYASPEQTGRVNRLVDYRTDLYSLGVTLYEIFTDTLPFNAQDALGWMHCHLARTPRALSEVNRDIPPGLSKVVLKLLKKRAEDRYQTAPGLTYDLEHCLRQWNATKRIPEFPLAQNDISDQFLIPQRLYDREHDLASLQRAFYLVAEQGIPELVLVTGYSGIGKTSMVQELARPVAQKRGFFISGKFDQFRRHVPYSTITEALRELIQQILTESEESVARWRKDIQQAVGLHGQVVVDVLPDLALIIGSQPSVSELPPAQSQDRFDTVFRRFLGVFAKKEHPLVLFLDDLQWVDPASLRLLERLVINPETLYLLVVGAYRDQEVTATHPLMLTLNKIRQGSTGVRSITLSPLTETGVGRLVADTLHDDLAQTAPLSKLIFEKTGGNPFFLIQFFTTLHEENLVEFDNQNHQWKWDLKRIQDKNYTENVIDFLVTKLNKLPLATQTTLGWASCIGNRFNLSALANARHLSLDELQTDIERALDERLVVRHSPATYRFVHDHVQQAANTLLNHQEKQKAHLLIGRTMLAAASPQEIHENIFEIVGQFNHSLAQIDEPVEKRQTALLNVQASQRAIAANAYLSARQFALAAWSLLDPIAWEDDYYLLRQTYDVLAQAEFLNGNLTRCQELIHEALKHLRTPLEKANFYNLLIIGQTLEGDYQEAVKSGLAGLTLLGIELPTRDYPQALKAEVEEIDSLLGNRHPAQLIDAPQLSDPSVQMAQKILINVDVPAYIGAPSLFPLIVAKMVHLSLLHGNSLESCKSLPNYGILLGAMFHQYQRGYEFARLGWNLVHKLKAEEIKCKTCIPVGGLTLPWAAPIKESLPIFEEGILSGMATGDLQFVSYSLFTQAHLLYVSGEALPALQTTLENALQYATLHNNQWAVDSLQSLRFAVMGLQRGATQLPAVSAQEENFAAECQTRKNASSLCIYHCYLAQRLFHAGQYQAAAEHAAKSIDLSQFIMGSVVLGDATFFHALALSKILPRHREEASIRNHIAQDETMLRWWRDSCPSNFDHQWLLVKSEIARLDGLEQEAMNLYERAILAARENGFVQGEGLASELASQFYRRQGFDRIADTCVINAMQCYRSWGAQSKIAQLEQKHPWLAGKHAVTDTGNQSLDAISVTKASQAISREITLSNLIDALMRTAIESAGAQKGCLVLLHNDNLVIESAAVAQKEEIKVTQPTEPETSSLVPVSILNYVRRTKEVLMLDDASHRYAYAADPYVIQHRPVSVLCLPLMRQNSLVGILYFENNLIRGAFTESRIAVLELLAAQAAISLENARIYETLREREKEIFTLVETSPIAIVITDLGNNVLMTNEKFVKQFGYTVKDVPNVEQWWSLAYPDEANRLRIRATWEKNLNAAIHARSEIIPMEEMVRCKNGEYRYVEFRASSVGNRVFVVFSDLTERQEAERERDRLMKTAQEANAAKDQFLAVLSHELRNPLAAIYAGTEVLKHTKSALERSAGRAIEVIERNAGLQARLVNDLLDLSRITRGIIELRRMPMPIDLVVGQAIQNAQAEANRLQIDLQARLLPNLYVDADADRLQQVVANLVSNALKFTPARGRVTVSLTSAEGKGRIVVEDTGIGIDSSQLQNIFEMFHSGDVKIRRAPGLGIGLALVKSLVEMHGGRVWAQSTGPGQGSRFTVELPLIPATAASPQREPAALPRQSVRVLVVEDNLDTQMMLEESLKMFGYQVVAVESGETGLEALARQQVDVILSDIGLPGMNGYEFLRRARQMPSMAKVPALAVTGYGQDRDARLAREAGFVGHFVKPIDLASLDQRIRESLVLTNS